MMTPTNFSNLWQSWIDEILKVVPQENKYFNLKNGISDSEVKAIETQLGFSLPENLIAFYKAYDVQYNSITSVFQLSVNGGSYDLLSFDRIGEEWIEIDNLNLEEEKLDLSDYSEKVEADNYSNPRWIPIAEERNGNYLLLDTDPSPKGSFGQIIELQNESWQRNVVANSLEELIQMQIDKLKSGEYKIDKFILSEG